MRTVIALLAICLACSCSSTSSAFSVSNAAADPTYWCPGDAASAPYDLHATARLHNPTSSAVTITAVTAEMKLEATKGPWVEKIGDVYDAGDSPFKPTTVSARSDTTLTVTIHSSCTSPAYGASTSHYGDYQVTLHIKTSAGSYSIAASNLHRILTA